MISPFVFGNYRKADMLTLAQAKTHKPDSFWKLAIVLIFRSSILCFTLSLGMATIALLDNASSVAQTSPKPNQMPLGEKTMSQVNVVFVNPSVGDDKVGNGGERTPWKTITIALQQAKPNTVIMLSSGTYSADTGEVFPLILKSGVSIQGDQSTKGRGIEIQGGGDYLSRSFGKQNVTIVGANQTGLTGVTVTNPNPRGYGLWIESSNPVIVENTFIGSIQDGISVNGNSTPTISKNYFYRNGANGITIAGSSRGEVRDNVFEQTGFGINIAQNAMPLIAGNQVKDNRTGIVIQANARPILRNNVISGSKEDGLVAIAYAMPDLGNSSEPGGNEFRNNARYDINASAAKQVISAFGNSTRSDGIAGKIDLQPTTASTTDSPNNAALPTSANREITFDAPSAPIPTPKPLLLRNNIPSGRLNPQLLPLQPANSPQAVSPQLPLQRGVFPTPSSLPGYQKTVSQALPTDTPQLNYARVDTNTIEFTAPSGQTNPVGAANLPLRIGNIPNGMTSNPTTNYSPNQSYASMGITQTALRYRVVVEINNQSDRDLVRFIAPGAFSTQFQGRDMMQAGVFSSRYNADEMMRILTRNGLRAVIEPATGLEAGN